MLLKSSHLQSGGRPAAVLAVEGQGPVMLVDAKALTDLGKSATDLRDHSVVGGLEPKDVKRLRVTRDGKAVLPIDSEQGKANSWHTDVTFVDRVPAISVLRAISRARKTPISDRGSEAMMATGWRKLPNCEARIR